MTSPRDNKPTEPPRKELGDLSDRLKDLSGRIAASMVDGLRVEVAPDPNEDALLALLGDPD